ncbi:UNVERIFIED_CONTAM: hypothetical protein Scaly_0585800 [Sesamum calycinum]|uniref:Retrotransposon gag domain-containing protein n=1 Tax=Sesamum calycinum TaxID=2727403 RepID=A0AAW2RRY2_9LAMI
MIGAFIVVMPPKSTQALEEAITAFSDRLSELHTSMELRHDSLVAAVSDIQQHLAAIPTPVTSFLSPAALSPLPPPIAAKPPKLHMQLFDGSAVLDWVFQAEQYFAIRPRLQLSPLSSTCSCLTVPPSSTGFFRSLNLSSWDAFIRALELRFGRSSFANHQAVLFKLRQRGSVAEFQAEFERLCNRVQGVAPPSATTPPGFVAGSTFSACDCPAPLARGAPGTAYQGPLFNCDEKFGPGHRCKAKQFMLLLSDNPPDLFDSCPNPEDVPSSPETALSDGVLFQLSPVAVSGSSSPRTLCLRGLICGHAISVLIDSDSSHNIIQPRVATFLSLAESSLPSFPVLVGNGAASTVLASAAMCHCHSSLTPSLFPSMSSRFLALISYWACSGSFILGPFSWISPSHPCNLPITATGLHLPAPSRPPPRFASFSHVCRFAATDSIHSLCPLSITALSSPPIQPPFSAHSCPPGYTSPSRPIHFHAASATGSPHPPSPQPIPCEHKTIQIPAFSERYNDPNDYRHVAGRDYYP